MILVWWLMVMATLHVLLTWTKSVQRGIRALRHREPSPERKVESWPTVSVIVPAWQERGTLETCIYALQRVIYPDWEIILVAGGSDGTYEIAQALLLKNRFIRLIEQSPTGKNSALNAGWRLAKGDVIVFLDADSRVEPNWLSELVRPLTQGAFATTGNYFPLRITPISLNGEMEKISAYYIQNTVTLQGSGSIALKREVLECLGGVPETVHVGVDWDLNARVAQRGYDRVFCPEAKLYTHRPATLSEWWRNEFRWRRAHFRSLFRLQSYFLRDLRSVIHHLYIYFLAWFSLIFTTFVGFLVFRDGLQTTEIALKLWGLFAAWLFLRKAAIVGEVAAFTNDRSLLRLAWVPPLLLCITLIISCAATLSSGDRLVHFKGPRVHRLGANEN